MNICVSQFDQQIYPAPAGVLEPVFKIKMGYIELLFYMNLYIH